MDLATALHANHQYPEAETGYKAVISLQSKVLGAEHAHTLNTRNNLAELLDDEGKYAEAETECRQIIEVETKVVGARQRLTLNSHANLAVAVIGQGRIEEAQEQLEALIPALEETLKLNTPTRLDSPFGLRTHWPIKIE